MEGGGWKVECGGWSVECGVWSVGYGRWRVEGGTFQAVEDREVVVWLGVCRVPEPVLMSRGLGTWVEGLEVWGLGSGV